MKEFIKNFEQESHISKLTYQHSGITLVALVVTIVVLLILAGVSITVLLGDDGIFKKAENAANATNDAVQDELEGINSLVDKIDEVLFKPTETPAPPTGGEKMTNMRNGIIEIKWLSGTSNNVSEDPNVPVIKTNFTDGTTMEQVVFDESSQEWIPGTEYSYVAGEGTNDNNASHWANARVTKNEVASYFVWIPRYAYRIIYFDSTESKEAYQNGTLTEEEAIADKKIIGYSDSRGIVDAQGRKISEVASTPKLMVSQDYFMVHPAFTSEVENGGWDRELAGIWVGKYETARSDTDGATQGIETTLKVQPGVTSYRIEDIGSMYTNAKAYDTNLQSHMLKNSEWGAVAYLTESKYGRNGTEIGFSNEGYITGGGEGKDYAENNQDQSTTGNVYGIYDMRGGAYEYVAAGLNNQSRIGTESGSNKYGTVYNSSGADQTSASQYYKYGDATYETSAWHSDYAYFMCSDHPNISRGGCYYETSVTGVFCYYRGYFR